MNRKKLNERNIWKKMMKKCWNGTQGTVVGLPGAKTMQYFKFQIIWMQINTSHISNALAHERWHWWCVAFWLLHGATVTEWTEHTKRVARSENRFKMRFFVRCCSTKLNRFAVVQFMTFKNKNVKYLNSSHCNRKLTKPDFYLPSAIYLVLIHLNVYELSARLSKNAHTLYKPIRIRFSCVKIENCNSAWDNSSVCTRPLSVVLMNENN